MSSSHPILERIIGMHQRNRLAQALLFVGPELSSMRDCALELSQYLFCAKTEAKPCKGCLACRKIANGSHPDLRTIETEKQEIKIEPVREAQKWLLSAPYEASRKVVVIVEADLLNRAASNALLKTLEEPLPHALIILIAHSTENLLPTVRSRVASIRFPESLESFSISKEEPPSWMDDLERFLEKPSSRAPSDIFDLTEAIAKERTQLPWFFQTVEKKLRDELLSGQAERLEKLFDLAMQGERDLLRRYGNIALLLDHFLLEWQSAWPR